MQLKSEGIVRPDDIIYFIESYSMKQIIKNRKRPAMITDPNNAGQTIAQEYFQCPAWSLMRLKVAAVAVDYYPKTSRPFAADNMVRDQRLKNF